MKATNAWIRLTSRCDVVIRHGTRIPSDASGSIRSAKSSLTTQAHLRTRLGRELHPDEDVLVLSDPDVRLLEERFRSADQSSRHAVRAEAAALTAEIQATRPLERLGDRIDAQARGVALGAEAERLRRESDAADTFATHPRFIIRSKSTSTEWRSSSIVFIARDSRAG